MTAANEPIFVVGTGRCGSTAVSSVIRTNPRWLSLSEFLSSLSPGAFPNEPLSGARFASMLAQSRPDANVLLANGLEPPEVLYPVDSPHSRFTRETGVPALALITLPHLDGVGDGLLDEICEEVGCWGVAPIELHYRRLFEWLRERFGAERWIERSGWSLAWAQSLVEHFPEARFVHLYRDSRRCVLSMARHAGFRMMLLRTRLKMQSGVDPYESDERPAALTEGDLSEFLPERFDRDAFVNDRFPLWWFALAWTSQVAHGVPVLAALPANRVLHMRFEDLIADPLEQVGRLATFVDGAVDIEWARRAAEEIRPGRSSADGELDAAAVAIVERGEQILHDAGL